MEGSEMHTGWTCLSDVNLCVACSLGCGGRRFCDEPALVTRGDSLPCNNINRYRRASASLWYAYRHAPHQQEQL